VARTTRKGKKKEWLGRPAEPNDLENKLERIETELAAQRAPAL